MFIHHYYYVGSVAELTAITVCKRCMPEFKTGPLFYEQYYLRAT